MKMPKLVVGYLMDDGMFVKSFTIPESHDWIKWLANEELAQFFGELLELMIQISEEKEDSKTLQTFLDFWHEIALSWREIALGEEDPEIFEEDSETPSTVVTDWSVDALEAALKGQDPATLLNSLAGFIGKAMISSERDVLADILEAEQELDSPWINIVGVEQDYRSPMHAGDAEPVVRDVTEAEQEKHLAYDISKLQLSARAHNCLKNENIKTVRELVAKMEWDLLEYKGLGQTTLNEIKSQLAGLGLYLGMDLFDEDDEEASF